MHGNERPPREKDQSRMIREHLQRCGLRQTHQRRIILEVFLEMKGHPTPEEIHKEIRRRGHKAGMASIYRLLKPLVEVGIVRKLEFGDGHGRYERHDAGSQHLHLVCQRCGQALEAPADSVEAQFQELAESCAFALHSHTTYLYGLCAVCRSIPLEKAAMPDWGD